VVINLVQTESLSSVDQVDERLNLIDKLADNIPDYCDQSKIIHTIKDMMVQEKIYGLIAEYEDLNDHSNLRNDSLYQTLLNINIDLASPSTLYS
jgi:hypothetical protein